MTNLTRAATALFVLAVSMGQTRPPDPLTLARQHYNAREYDEAIVQALQAATMPEQADAAAVVLARAHLERYRLVAEASDLTAAREALKGVQAANLSPRDATEFTIGLGESIFLDDQYSLDDRYSAAAELFDIALGRADLLDAESRDRLFDWWALSLDRQAQLGPESGRMPAYSRIVERAEQELRQQPTSTSATYWLAAAACGAEDLTRAWGAAVAGWVRAASLGNRGTALRGDLDRLVVQVILPERAKQLAAGSDARPVLASLKDQWERIKEHWQ